MRLLHTAHSATINPGLRGCTYSNIFNVLSCKAVVTHFLPGRDFHAYWLCGRTRLNLVHVSALIRRSGLFPSCHCAFAHSDCVARHSAVFGVFRGVKSRTSALCLRPSTKIGFAENQLSPRLPGISLLPTNHPRILQHSPVRSTTCS